MAKSPALDVLQRALFAAEVADVSLPAGWPAHAELTTLLWNLRQLPGSLADALAEGRLAAMTELPLPVLAFIDDALQEREQVLLRELEAAVPPGVLAMRKLRGIGGKKVRALWQELGITTVGELEYACRENRLLQLKGFGDKTQANLLAQCAELAQSSSLLRRDQAELLAAPILAAARAAGLRAILAGHHRAGHELCEDVRIVLDEALASDIKSTDPRVRVRTAPAHAWGITVIEETGPAEHVAALQARASKLGRAWHELHGDEDDVYTVLQLHPHEAEARGAVLVEVGHAKPRLVSRSDVRGSLHNHTHASDGTHSADEMREAAQQRGLAYLAITDHSVSSFYARGLSSDALLAQQSSWRARPALGPDACQLLMGVESDILRDGALDYDKDVLQQCDVVVASVHQRFAQTAAQATERLVAAVKNPCTHILGHPTGRLLLSRPASDADWEAVLRACAQHHVAVELNANPARLDFGVPLLAMARDMGVLISIAADAHAAHELDYLDHGVAVARKAGLRAEHVLNTRTLPELRTWLTQPRA
jgi:DNA polymerase (family X)